MAELDIRKATWLGLFYDLVYVAVIANNSRTKPALHTSIRVEYLLICQLFCTHGTSRHFLSAWHERPSIQYADYPLVMRY